MRASGSPSELFYEKRVNSLRGLKQEASLLDLDSGIRTYGDYKGKKRYVFVTRSPSGYTLMIYGMRPRGRQPGLSKRLLVKEFESEEELYGFMEDVVTRPVRAFIY